MLSDDLGLELLDVDGTDDLTGLGESGEHVLEVVGVGDAEGVCVLPARLAEEIADQCVEDELREEWGLWRVSEGEPIDTTFPMHESRQAEYEAWKRDVKGLG